MAESCSAALRTRKDTSSSTASNVCHLMACTKQYSNKAVKKALTIPQWLNTIAEREGINFSGTLQNALIERLYVNI
jgi:hypothetical protein